MKITCRLPMSEYLALPAVSAGVLRAMINDCPLAAWHESWLNPWQLFDNTDKTDRGTIVHSILLEGNRTGIEVIDPMNHPADKTGNIPDGWTNKSIRAARDAARDAGKIPILKSDYAAINNMVESALEYLESIGDDEPDITHAFYPAGGESELTIEWTQAGVPCRIRPDRISADQKLIVDIKTTSGSANPAVWARSHLFPNNLYMGAAFYGMGCQAAFQTLPRYVYLVIQSDAPYLCSLVGLDNQAMEIGESKALHALEMWSGCVELNSWPAYPTRVCYPEMPGWITAEWEEKMTGIPYDVAKLWEKS